MQTGYKRPGGDITTLLDLTPRDVQDNAYTPLTTDSSWFARDSTRRFTPFTPVLQDFPFRGPASFGQRFSFDIASQTCGDLLLGAMLQIQLSSWLDLTTILRIQMKELVYVDPTVAWFYANALGLIIIQKVELEIDGVTIESVDGDFSTIFSLLFQDLNAQFGIAEHTGVLSMQRLLEWPSHRVYPTESGYIHCMLPLFFGRTKLKEAFALLACREGSVRIHVTLRPFSEVIRQARGFRDTCDATPLSTSLKFLDKTLPFIKEVNVDTPIEAPQFQNVRLLVWSSIVDGNVRSAMLRQPFETMYREVQTFYFSEPLRYVLSRSTTEHTVRIQLPLEANHPIEEILWFIRRKDVNINNEWTNYSAVLEKDYDPIYNPLTSMLLTAKVQANGIDLVEAEEGYFRHLIAKHHKGGITAYNRFIYGYPIAKHPSLHQPSGTLNASRLQTLRLTLDIQAPQNVEWEVKVYCIGLNWLRFQNGIANRMFED